MKNLPLKIAFGILFTLFLVIYAVGLYHYRDQTPQSFHHTGSSTHQDWSQSLLHENPTIVASFLRGAKYFRHTSSFASLYVGNSLSCTQCHLGGGQENGILGLVDIASYYPEWDEREGKKITLVERIQSCFLRSENGKAPPVENPVIKDLKAYVESIRPFSENSKKPWRNLIQIPKEDLIPIEKIEVAQGKFLFDQQCAFCHGHQGNPMPGIPPVWGNESFNDGAGLARVYTLASFIQRGMPLGGANSLNNKEAQEIAAYIDSQKRPVYAGKQKDYPQGDIPVDAVYYPQRYPTNPLQPFMENKYKE